MTPRTHRAVEKDVPLVDLARQHEELRGEILSAIENLCMSSAFILGREVEAFEQEFAAFCGSGSCVGVSSGCEALALALEALGVGPGDEVITPCNTFIATALAISRRGARPVLVDCREQDFLIDIDAIPEALTDRTKLLLPVHLYGQSANMTAIERLARERGLLILEDAAQAHGATHNGQPCGSLGNAAAFSFYPAKNLGCLGDGGAVTSHDGALLEYVRCARDYGQKEKYHHTIKGWNARLDALQAAVLRIKLRKLRDWNRERQECAAFYSEHLKDLPLALPATAPGNTHVFHLYVCRHPERDRILEFLRQRGIHGGIHYPVPVHLHDAYRDLDYGPGRFPQAEKACREIFSLPLFPGMSRAELERTIEALHSFFSSS